MVDKTEENQRVSVLNNWNEEKINGTEGLKKIHTLQYIARYNHTENANPKFQHALYNLLKAKEEYQYKYVYNDIPVRGGCRRRFEQEFNSDSDKEFLVKLMAKKFLEKNYDFDSQMVKRNHYENSVQNDIIKTLIPTIQKYGKEHTMNAISRIILYGNYDSISKGQVENKREHLEQYEKNVLLENISKPLIDELEQKREISDELREAVNYSIYKTEEKYPGTIGERLSKFVETYKEQGKLNFNHFSKDGRQSLAHEIKNSEDVENLIGIICENYSDKANLEQDMDYRNNNINLYFKNIANRMGKDSFRETMISAIIRKNYDGFSPDVSRYFSTIDRVRILNVISVATIEMAKNMPNLERKEVKENVSIQDLKENAETQKLPVINKILGELKGEFGVNSKIPPESQGTEGR